MKFKEFWTLAFCENKEPSSKRIMGAITILMSVIYTGYLTVAFGATEIVKDLIVTEITIGGLLLGISNVTDIWKKTAVPPVEPTPEPEPSKVKEEEKEDYVLKNN
jgi:hypothetical protein